MLRSPLPLLFLACSCATASWRVEIVLAAGEKLGGCAAGELLPGRPGPELVAVGASGTVYLASQVDGAWHGEEIFVAPGELIQVAVGDVLPEIAGDEIVAVGMAAGPEQAAGPGVAWLLSRQGQGWRSEKILDDPALLHGVCIHDGTVYATGFSNRVVRILGGPGNWRHEFAGALPGAGKTMVAVGDGLAVACTDGSLCLVGPSTTGWTVGVLDQRPAGRARLGTDGTRIAVADDDGTLSLVDLEGNRMLLHKEREKLRGAVLAELDPSVPGPEAACVGYGKELVVLTSRGGAWRGEVVHREPDRFHHLTAIDVDGDGVAELLAAGYAGNLILARRR